MFFFLLIIVGALSLQLGYSVELSNVIASTGVFRTAFELKDIPGPALLSSTWVLFSFVLLRYYQTTLHIEKQYSYIHTLESSLNEIVGKEVIYRESKAYETDKSKVFRLWTWLSFTLLYPVMIILALVFLQVDEWRSMTRAGSNRVFDLIVASVGAVTVVLYLLGAWSDRIRVVMRRKQYSGRLKVRIPSKLHACIATEAAGNNKSVNQWVTEKLCASVSD